MPELPDVVAYIEAMRPRIAGQTIRRVHIASPFVVRSVDPTIGAIEGCVVRRIGRLGKRIVFDLSEALFLIVHPMIAGRFRWLAPGAKSPGRISLARLEFDAGALVLTEAAKKKRAAIHVVSGWDALAAHDAGGLELLDPHETHVLDGSTDKAPRPVAVRATAGDFLVALRRSNNTLKRALTDPRRFSGIGNAYSDECLHAARLSPIALTHRLTDEEASRLYAATCMTLSRWIQELRRDFAERFPGPGGITAMRPGFAVHGRFGHPCPVCKTPVQRIRYAENETNYCPTCQTRGRVLADRSLSRLLRDDWPRTVEELESPP